MIYIALGANLSGRFEGPEFALREAARVLSGRSIDIAGRSGLWLSAPVPASDQPWYRNAVIAARTEAEPMELLHILQDVEADFGRVRTVRNAPRVLDLDLIAYHDRIIREGEDLIVPHPRMHERGFVLRPLAQLDPGWVHPVSGRRIDDLIATLPAGQDERLMEGMSL